MIKTYEEFSEVLDRRYWEMGNGGGKEVGGKKEKATFSLYLLVRI